MQLKTFSALELAQSILLTIASLASPCCSTLSLGTNGKKFSLQPNMPRMRAHRPPPPTPLIASKWPALSALLGAKPFPPSMSLPSSPLKHWSFTFACASLHQHTRTPDRLEEVPPRWSSPCCADTSKPLAMPSTTSLLTLLFSKIRIFCAQPSTCKQLKEACLRSAAGASRPFQQKVFCRDLRAEAGSQGAMAEEIRLAAGFLQRFPALSRTLCLRLLWNALIIMHMYLRTQALLKRLSGKGL